MQLKKDLIFIPEGDECKICGIGFFAHKHKAGSKPNEFEIIDESMNQPKQEEWEETIKPMLYNLIEIPGKNLYILEILDVIAQEIRRAKDEMVKDILKKLSDEKTFIKGKTNGSFDEYIGRTNVTIKIRQMLEQTLNQ